MQELRTTANMSDIPYDLLPMRESEFAHMRRFQQNQSFVSRFFGTSTSNKRVDDTSCLSLTNVTKDPPYMSASTFSSHESLGSKMGSVRITVASSTRPRSNTADSSTSVASFVSQHSTHGNALYRREQSRSSSHEASALLDDGWKHVNLY